VPSLLYFSISPSSGGGMACAFSLHMYMPVEIAIERMRKMRNTKGLKNDLSAFLIFHQYTNVLKLCFLFYDTAIASFVKLTYDFFKEKI